MALFLLGYQSPPDGLFSTDIQKSCTGKDLSLSWNVEARDDAQVAIVRRENDAEGHELEDLDNPESV